MGKLSVILITLSAVTLSMNAQSEMGKTCVTSNDCNQSRYCCIYTSWNDTSGTCFPLARRNKKCSPWDLNPLKPGTFTVRCPCYNYLECKVSGEADVDFLVQLRDGEFIIHPDPFQIVELTGDCVPTTSRLR